METAMTNTIIDTTAIREVSTVTSDGCKLKYTYLLSNLEIVSICVIDVMNRMVPAQQRDCDDARWHLDNCVRAPRRALQSAE